MYASSELARDPENSGSECSFVLVVLSCDASSILSLVSSSVELAATSSSVELELSPVNAELSS